MSQEVLGKFDKGETVSQTSERTDKRGTRRLYERSHERRERLLRVLHIMKFLPDHFDCAIGWNKEDNKTYGKFIGNDEPKIAWKKDEDGKMSFIFMDSFNEMLADFARRQPAWVADGHKIPLDWTLFYLRNKALTHPISKEELAWIILNFNQKRGYYQLRGEEEETEETDNTKKEEYMVLRVDEVIDTGEKRGDSTWYDLKLENGWVYHRPSKIPLDDWAGKDHEFIVTTEYENDGVTVKTDKEGQPKRSFRAPGENDWGLQKKRTESIIEKSKQTVGTFIYETLLNEPSAKIRGKLVRTIERKYYKDELKTILAKQSEFYPEFHDTALLERCACELYPKNLPHQRIVIKNGLKKLITDDIIFYQRPLKSKKSLISDCPYEKYEYVDKSTGEIKVQHIKCIAKSNPYYQEFRLWQFIRNLRLISTGLKETDVTSDYLPDEESYVRLFMFLNDRKSIKQGDFLTTHLGIKKPKGKDSKMPVRWNYVEDKEYPCNETRYVMLAALKKAHVDSSFLNDKNTEYQLWHILYSVEDKHELESALATFAAKHGLEANSFVEAFKKVPAFKKEYGAYSEKAIKKLLSVMRTGSMWNPNDVPESVHKVINGDISDTLKERMSHQNIRLSSIDSFKFLPVWLACYVVYGRHSESASADKWRTPEDLQAYISDFKQYSLRNPIVEQCVLETLRTVHDIWVKYGHIDEIHVELGREMKCTADQRKRMADRNKINEDTNMRIRKLLVELKNDSRISDVRPYSPIQQDILRIYEEGALQELKKDDNEYKEIKEISAKADPTPSELERYKLWLDQKYRSPYTGRTIPLAKLFTPAYQIEHVIPQARYFDDSFSNKVICEAEVNQLKSNRLGMEFIKECGGQIVGDVQIFNEHDYIEFIKEHYSGNRTKAQKLMMEDIPEEFIQRQMNDSRYISKVIISLLSNIVREDNEPEATSKNVISCTGGITTRLKEDWGLNDVWNDIVSPRFKRLNAITGTSEYGMEDNKGGKRVFQTKVPEGIRRGFNKKRIDHRHHAMDALVIALASRNIISYLNNGSARDTVRREDLRRKLCDHGRIIRKPWATFTQDARVALENIVVSFKHYVRVINRTTNHYEHYNDEGKKVRIPQQKGERWAIRKPLHKETVYGSVNLHRSKELPVNKALEHPENIVDKPLKLKVQEKLDEGWTAKQIAGAIKNGTLNGKRLTTIEVYYFTDDTAAEQMVAVRKPLDKSFNENKIKTITDTGIQKILLNWLEAKGDNSEVAFSPEGIIEMNNSIAQYNNGKPHQPILRVRLSEPKGEKYAIGASGINKKKFVEAQKGTNLYFAVYEDGNSSRSYCTMPLNHVVERLKQGLSPVPETNEKGIPLKFFLCPNDLVYVPTDDERLSANVSIDRKRIYKMVSATGNQVFFLPAYVAVAIHDKKEYQVLNKISNLDDGTSIKSVCWKLEVNRIGEITNIIR